MANSRGGKAGKELHDEGTRLMGLGKFKEAEEVFGSVLK